ncbi:DNA-dependent RNA polymerase ii largest subunit [Colletotrichum asianum]|uniref:DNA-dependent RNA polymerase ii largest subunit n=1 Tax=Colletotrichum asianum TaxID=702518 RepID=A0A8H3ZNY3_9PEZI|nr:DNA-dependent RNA polymerase ii largest subunit [Colletotrichum asianum]
MQRFQRSEDPFEEELCFSLASKARDLDAVLGVTIDTFQSAENRFYVEIIFYGCKAERNMTGRLDWFEEPFGIQVHSVTVRWSRLIVSFSDVEQAWKLLQAYETAEDDFYVNYRLAMARPIDIRAIPIFCKKCGRPWHLEDSCLFLRRCSHCTKNHPSDECPVKDKEKEKQCGNCLGRHSVISPRCFSEQVAIMKRICAEIDNAGVDWYIAKIRSLQQQTQRPPADAPQYVDLTDSTQDSVGDDEDMYNDVDLNASDYDQVFSAIESNSQPAEVPVEKSVASTAAAASTTPAAHQPSAPKNTNGSSNASTSKTQSKGAPNAAPRSTTSSVRKPLAPKSANASSKPQSGCNKAKSTTSAPAPNARNAAAGKSVNRPQCKEGTRKRLASTAVSGSTRPKTRVRTDKTNNSTNSSTNAVKTKSSRSERRKRCQERKAAEGESSNTQKAAEPKPSNKSTAKSNKQRVQKATPPRKAMTKSNNHARTTPISGASSVVTAPTSSVHNSDQPSPVASSGGGMVKYFGTSSPASIQSLDIAALLNPVFPRTSDRGNSQPPMSNSSLTGSAADSFTGSDFAFTGSADSSFTGSAASFTGVSASTGSDAFTTPSQCMSSSSPRLTTSGENLFPASLPPLSSLVQGCNASSLPSPATPSRSGNDDQPVTPSSLGVIVNEGNPYHVSKPAAKASAGTSPTTVLTPPPSSQPPTAAHSTVHPAGSGQKTVGKSRNHEQTPCRSSRAAKNAIAAQPQLLPVARDKGVVSCMWPKPKGPQSMGGDDVVKEMAWLGDG